MPVTKSAAKRVRQNLKRHKRNLKVKQVMRRDIKALVTAIAENNAQAIRKGLTTAQSSLDKAVKAGIIHKNKASRQKSKLSKLAIAKATKPTTKTASKTTSKTTSKPTTAKPAAAKSRKKPAAK